MTKKLAFASTIICPTPITACGHCELRFGDAVRLITGKIRVGNETSLKFQMLIASAGETLETCLILSFEAKDQKISPIVNTFSSQLAIM